MKISVILPIYNTDKYLKDALDSIINQSYRDLEIICVDDGSTDNCPDILRDYQLKDSRISVITQKNMGTYLARRRGVENAHGDYILLYDTPQYQGGFRECRTPASGWTREVYSCSPRSPPWHHNYI